MTLYGGGAEKGLLPAAFERVVTVFVELRRRYDLAELSEAEFTAALCELLVVDSSGGVWTVGACSGQWYLRTADGKWTPSTPPARAEDESVESEIVTDATRLGVVVLGTLPVVTSVGHAVSLDQPYPEVQDTGSTMSLPEFFSSAVVIDEHGVWDSSFTAVDEEAARQEPTEAEEPADDEELEELHESGDLEEALIGVEEALPLEEDVDVVSAEAETSSETGVTELEITSSSDHASDAAACDSDSTGHLKPDEPPHPL